MEEESGGDEFFHPSTCISVAQFCFCVREKLLFSVRRNKMCERRGRKKWKKLYISARTRFHPEKNEREENEGVYISICEQF